MSSSVNINGSRFLSIKEATRVAPYSRDYVARLAREGKVLAVQLNRQWHIDEKSLRSFLESTEMEEKIRKNLLSLSRKKELEVSERKNTHLGVLKKKKKKTTAQSLVQASLVLVFGFMAGTLLLEANSKFDFNTETLTANSSIENPTYFWEEDQLASTAVAAEFVEVGLMEVTKVLSLENGVVIFRQGTKPSDEVFDFFSDEVEVKMVGTTTGMMKAVGSSDDTALPFVRIPENNNFYVTEVNDETQ